MSNTRWTLAVVVISLFVLAVGGSVFASQGFQTHGWTYYYLAGDKPADYRDLYGHFTVEPKVTLGQVQKSTGSGAYADWNAEVSLEFAAGDYDRTDYPVVLDLDLGAALKSAGISGSYDSNSLRVIEVAGDGSVKAELPSQYDAFDMEGTTQVAFQIPGNTPAGTVRSFVVYFDSTANGRKHEPEYQTALVWDPEVREIKNADMKTDFYMKSGMLKFQSLKVGIDSEGNDAYLGAASTDDSWICVGQGGEDVWLGVNDQYGIFEVLSAGPVRYVFKTDIYFRTNKISQIKYYIVYNTGTYIEWDVTYTLENDADIAKSLEAFRSWFSIGSQIADFKNWTISHYDGEKVFTQPRVDSHITLKAAEDWSFVDNDTYGWGFILSKTWAPGNFFVFNGVMLSCGQGSDVPQSNL